MTERPESLTLGELVKEISMLNLTETLKMANLSVEGRPYPEDKRRAERQNQLYDELTRREGIYNSYKPPTRFR